MTRCPYCKEEIQAGATVCKHCGKRIGKPAAKKWTALAGIGLGVIAVSCMCFGLSMATESSIGPDEYSMIISIGLLLAAAGIISLLLGLIGKGFSK